MIEKLKQILFKTYNPEEKKGVFFSYFDKNHILLSSDGVLETDKPLYETFGVLSRVYLEGHEKKIYYLVCDIVSEIIEINKIEKVLEMSPEEFGFIVVDKEDNISGTLLPNTVGISDSKSALSYIKKKYGIHGNVEIFAFRTERIVISK